MLARVHFYSIRIIFGFLLSILGLTAFAQNSTLKGKRVSPLDKRILAVCKEVEENGRTTDRLVASDFQQLPVGLVREVNGKRYIIAIDSAYHTQQGWFFTAYAALTIPGTTEQLAFAGRGIAFNGGGIAATNSSKLVLVSDHSINMGHSELVIPGDGHNYLEFDCNGFKAVNLKGNFLFNEGLLVPEDATQHQVSATFEVNASDLNNIMISTSVAPFQVKGLKGFSFAVTKAVVDLSDFANPSGFSFPSDYQQTYGADISLWRGFYLQELTVKLPKELADQGERAEVKAKDMLIDEMGVSGLFQLNHLINASADGWPLSVNSLSIQLVRNRLRGGGFAGDVRVPFLNKEPMEYEAMIMQGDAGMEYSFAIKTTQDKEYSIPLAGKVKLNKGCIIKVATRNEQFIPSAELQGSLNVKASGLLEMEGIAFEHLKLTTQKPYLLSGVFSSIPKKGETTGTSAEGQKETLAKPKAGGFPVSLDSISLGIYQGQVALGVGIALNFTGKNTSTGEAGAKEEAKGFGASTFVQVLAKMEEKVESTGEGVRKSQEWKFDRVKIHDVHLECHSTAFDLGGTISFFDHDPIYGNGFKGNITFAIKKIMTKPAQVNAYFGSLPSFRYWHLDIYVPIGKIPIVPPVYLAGIIGGASYRMVRPSPFTPDYTALSPTGQHAARSVQDRNAYVPDSTAGLGFMAGLTLVVAKDQAFNADVVLEVAFNKGGGLRYIEFRGDGYFFSGSESRDRSAGASDNAPVHAGLKMRFDNENDVLHANLRTFVNLPGGIKGVGPSGLVGEAIIHVDRKDWYMYIGRPTQMLGVDLMGIAVAQSYFMIGTKIEDLPLPPTEVTSMFKSLDTDFMRDENSLSSGKGFAMGHRMRVGYDSKGQLSPFFVLLEVGAGVDVMLRNYGTSASCKGRDGGLGIDGWYASGQAYVFLRGRVGICIKKCSKKFDIISLGAAALLQAKLPNPSWMQGAIAGQYSILGGLVKGKVNAKFTLGEECELVTPGNELGDIVVIEEIAPSDGSPDVNVFSAPQVSFNTAIGQELRMTNTSDEVHTYRIIVDEVKLYQGKTEVPGTLQWNDRQDVVVINTPDVLPSQAKLKIVAKVHWEKKIQRGGWEPLKNEHGAIDYELKESTFTSGLAPNNIPEENVAYSYPIKHQYNFYTQEHGQGYIKLKKGQPYLFVTKDSLTTWNYVAHFTASGTVLQRPLVYNESEQTVRFDFPTELKQATVYSMNLVRVPAVSGSVDANVTRSETQVQTGDAENTVQVTRNELSGTLTQDIEKNVYESDFRTSKFKSFADKVNAFSGKEDLFDIAKGNVAVIGKSFNSNETFDLFEVEGKDTESLPLVQLEASTDNTWFKEVMNPLLYEQYPAATNVTIDWRKTSLLGIAPLKGVRLHYVDGNKPYQLTQNQASSGTAPAYGGRMIVGYYLSYYTFFDYSELINKAAANYLETDAKLSEGVTRLLKVNGYTDLKKGSYPVNVKYVLPGTGKVTSSQVITIRF